MKRFITSHPIQLLCTCISILSTTYSLSMAPNPPVMAGDADTTPLVVNEQAAEQDLKNSNIGEGHQERARIVQTFIELRNDARNKLRNRNLLFPWNWGLTKEEYDSFFQLDEQTISNKLNGSTQENINTLIEKYKTWKDQGFNRLFKHIDNNATTSQHMPRLPIHEFKNEVTRHLTYRTLGYAAGITSVVAANMFGNYVADNCTWTPMSYCAAAGTGALFSSASYYLGKNNRPFKNGLTFGIPSGCIVNSIRTTGSQSLTTNLSSTTGSGAALIALEYAHNNNA